MNWIVENYDNLYRDFPKTFMFLKNNILERHITKEEFDKICNNKIYTPLLTQNHKVDGVINYYKDGLYYERNDYWYTNHFKIKDKKSFENLVSLLGVKDDKYLGFAPGACYIIPVDNIRKWPKWFYEELRDAVAYTQLPAEAHLIERCMHKIFNSDGIKK